MLKPFPTKNKEVEKTVCRKRTAWACELIQEEEAVSCPTCKSVITVSEGVREKERMGNVVECGEGAHNW